MSNDPFAEFKKRAREGWAHFIPVEAATTIPAANLVRFAQVQAGQSVLDVATGTGVVAITARRLGAKVTGLDLTPELLARAKENAAVAQVDGITWTEGDAEALPYPDASFDVVLSQFGHMFAPQPELATKELLRVLKPGGRIAFSTWPPEQCTGQMFALIGRYLPPPPGVAPPPQWGNPQTVRERLGQAVRDIFFERGIMSFPVLSPQHYVLAAEKTVGPVVKLTQTLESSDPAKLAAFRKELAQLVSDYLVGNDVRQEYRMTRGIKV